MEMKTEQQLDGLIKSIAEVGKRLSETEASEGAAGNISLCLRKPVYPRDLFPLVSQTELPLEVPELEGATFIVSGSGCRLREIIDEPTALLACLVVDKGGKTASMYKSPRHRFERVTSEFNSHLAVHYDQIKRTGADFHAVLHAQPLHLTFLSHIPRYHNEQFLNTHLFRWQPETILNLPEGIGLISFKIPGSSELMAASVESLRAHRLVIWAKHGVMVRSDVSVGHAEDQVEYIEAAARYEYLNLVAGEIGEGLSADEIRAICCAQGIEQTVF